MEERIKYKLVPSASFRRDMKSLSETERQETREVIQRLARGEELDEKYRDHQLRGKLKSFRDCHVRPDLVLIYRINIPRRRASGYVVLIRYRSRVHTLYCDAERRGMKPSTRINGDALELYLYRIGSHSKLYKR